MEGWRCGSVADVPSHRYPSVAPGWWTRDQRGGQRPAPGPFVWAVGTAALALRDALLHLLSTRLGVALVLLLLTCGLLLPGD